MSIDHALVHSVEQLFNGANVHVLRTVLICYEKSKPGSKRQQRYEELLRTFVAESRRSTVALTQARQLCEASAILQIKSERLKLATDALRKTGRRDDIS